MDIKAGLAGVAGALSNFTPRSFVVDGVACASMEGFLQSLKFASQPRQREVCAMVGKAAKQAGAAQEWHVTQKLYWRGQTIDRNGPEFRRLICRAYAQMLAQDPTFKRDLLAAGHEEFDHSIGCDDPQKTVLTRLEFIACLNAVRKMARGEVKNPYEGK